MARWGSADFKQLKRVNDNLKKLQSQDIEAFCRECSKELAARLLGKVIRRTPTGEYDKPVNFTTKDGKNVSFQPHTGKVGGTLKKGWTGEKSMAAKAYAYSLPITRKGNEYEIVVKNPIEYASYVEFGHRKRGGKGWVEGRFMLTISENEIEAQAPKLLEKKLMEYLRKCFE
jgi:hypothetical protein